MVKCIYCGCEISDGRAMEVCDKCGNSVWGEKMFNTIVKNMETARTNGDLCHDNMIREVTRETNSFSGF